MKKLFITLALCTAFTAYTQTSSRKTIATESSFKVYESIIDSDTMVYYYFSFQNQKYQHITDLGSFLLNKKEDVLLFAQQLKEFSEVNEKVTQKVSTKNYELDLYDFSNNIYLSDSKGKYTTFTKKQAAKLSQALPLYLKYLKD